MKWLLVVLTVLLCLQVSVINLSAASVDFEKDIQPILTVNCAIAGCHVPGGSAPMSLQAGVAYTNLLNPPPPINPRVVPGLYPTKNILVQRLDGILSPRMPLGANPLSQAQINLIIQWIAEGALPFVVQPQLAIIISASSLAFGNVTIRTTSQQSFTVWNKGDVGDLLLSFPFSVLEGPDTSQFTAIIGPPNQPLPYQAPPPPGPPTGPGGEPVSGTPPPWTPPPPNYFGISVGTGVGIYVTFAPTSPGTKTATLRITHNAPGSPALINLTGTGVYPPPQPIPEWRPTGPPSLDFSVTNTKGQGELEVRFSLNAQNFRIRANGILWNFGDGETSKEPHPEHLYRKPGEYTVKVTVTTETGEVYTKTKEKFVVVTERPPQINFVASVLSGEAPLLVKFTVVSSGGPVTSYSWNFGDSENTNSTEMVINHTYRSAGTYTVVLKVSGPGGSDTKTKEGFITVTEPKPVITVSTNNLSFGSVEIDENKTLAFSVGNSGKADLTVNTGRSGSNSSEFTANPTAFTVKVGQPAQTVSVVFSPASAGSKSAVLVLNHNAPGNPIQVSLSGAGVLPPPPPTTALKNPVVPNAGLGARNHGKQVLINGTWYTHAGVDLLAPCASPVYAFVDGVVWDKISSGRDRDSSALGYMVIVKHKVPIKGKETYSLYLHMQDSPSVEIGQTVVGGKTMLGKVGKTGKAGGVCHTHFEVRHFSTRYFLNPVWNDIYGSGDQRNSQIFLENWENPEELFAETTLSLPLTPDFNGDGVVDIKDLFLFADVFWQAPTGEKAKFDLNRDGKIDVYDFFIFADSFGKRV